MFCFNLPLPIQEEVEAVDSCSQPAAFPKAGETEAGPVLRAEAPVPADISQLEQHLDKILEDGHPQQVLRSGFRHRHRVVAVNVQTEEYLLD